MRKNKDKSLFPTLQRYEPGTEAVTQKEQTENKVEVPPKSPYEIAVEKFNLSYQSRNQNYFYEIFYSGDNKPFYYIHGDVNQVIQKIRNFTFPKVVSNFVNELDSIISQYLCCFEQINNNKIVFSYMNDKEFMIFIQIECNLFKDETLVKTWINENSNEEYFFQNNSPDLKRLLEDIIEDIEQHGISQKDVERQFKNPYKD